MQFINWISHNEVETIGLGKKFAQSLGIRDIVKLEGDLGAGKTEFVKGICEYFKVEDLVTSPTFTIINQYSGKNASNADILIYHIDLYRIKEPLELDEIGFSECLYDSDSIKLIEWPQNAKTYINKYDWKVNILIDDNDDNLRNITIERS